MTITDKTRKLLWGNSGTRCAACYRRLVIDETEVDDPSVVGDECHIISAQENGPRYDAAYPLHLIDTYENLVLLCRVDHKRIDDQEQTFGVARLRSMKAEHERRVAWALEHADEVPHDITDPGACVARYVQAFAAFHSSDLAMVTSIPVTVDGHSETSTSILDSLPAASIVITGISGSGKTHLMRHLALRIAETGGMPIFARASAFDGDIERLLDRAVASFDNASYATLRSICAAADVPLSLFIDALNECPPALHDRLREGATRYARGPFASVWVTSTGDPHLPAFEHRVEFKPLTAEDRQRVFAAHAPRVIIDVSALTMFETPFAIAIAAEMVRDAPHALSTYELLDRFTDARLRIAERPVRARALLQRAACEMGRTFRASIARRTLLRLAEEVASPDPIGEVETLLRSGLLRADSSDISFMHEQVQVFYEATALMDTSSDISAAVTAPDARRLAPFVLAGLDDAEMVRACAIRLSDAALVADMLRGTLGSLSLSVATADARSLLNGAQRAIQACGLRIERDTERYALLPARVVFEGLPPLTTYEAALCAAIGIDARRGGLLKEILALLRTTETVVYGASHPRDRASLFADLFVVGSYTTSCAAATLVRAAANGWFSSTGDVLQLVELIEPPSQMPDGVLYLGCKLLRRSDATCTDALRIFREAWSRRIYHLSLAALEFLQSRRSISTENETAQVRGMIESCLGENIMLNTAVADVMISYDVFQSPVSEDGAAREFADVLAAPESAEMNERAYHLIGNIFEEIFQDAYYTALHDLAAEDQVSILIRAARGADLGGFHLDWILHRLAAKPEPRMLPAFVQWATTDPAGSSFPQSATVAFFLSVGACAVLGHPFAVFEQQSAAHDAWRTLAEIAYAANGGKPRAPIPTLWLEVRDRHCDGALEPLKDLDLETLVLERGFPVVMNLFVAFPYEIKGLLEMSVTRGFAAISIHHPGSPWFDRNDAARFVIGKLAAVGDEQTISLLKPYASDPVIGVEVVNAIRAIRRR
jgi:hypothetical protein